AFFIMPRLLPVESEKTLESTAPSLSVSVERDEIDQLISGGKTAVEIGKFCLQNSSICKSGQSALMDSGWQWLPKPNDVMGFLTSYVAPPEAAMHVEAEQPPQNIPVPTSRESILRQLR